MYFLNSVLDNTQYILINTCYGIATVGKWTWRKLENYGINRANKELNRLGYKNV